MKSSPKIDTMVSNIWQQQPIRKIVQATSTLDDSSTDEYSVQPPIKKIEVVYLNSTGSTANSGEHENTETASQAPDGTSQDEMKEEHKPVSISPAKSSLSSPNAHDFYNPEEL